MIAESTLKEILAVYDKHGWFLRRVLLSDELKTALARGRENLFGRVEIVLSELDALWFSRASRPDSEAWEIRHLSEIPFALVEVIDHSLNEEERNDVLRSAEQKMSGIIKSRSSGN